MFFRRIEGNGILCRDGGIDICIGVFLLYYMCGEEFGVVEL